MIIIINKIIIKLTKIIKCFICF